MRPSELVFRLVILAAAAVAIAAVVMVALDDDAPDATSAANARAASVPAAPIHESIERALRRMHREGDAEAVMRACAGDAAGSCACRQVAAERAFDGNLSAEPLALLRGADAACRESPTSQGMEAEALARAGKLDEAMSLANAVLQRDPENPYATYAHCYVAYRMGDLKIAVELSHRAIARKRGAAAHLLFGLIAYHAKNYEVAKQQFSTILTIRPNDLDANFNLGVVANATGDYEAARRHYQEVLRFHAEHFDARFNLILVLHRLGRTDEVDANLEKLRGVAAVADPRLASLQALLAHPPPPVAASDSTSSAAGAAPVAAEPVVDADAQ